MSPMDDLIAALGERRKTLSAELEQLTAPPPPGSAIGFGKRVGEGTSEAVERLTTTAAARSLTASIAGIDRALEKIAEGSYGGCDRCGEVIAASRLEALPASSLCVACARS